MLPKDLRNRNRTDKIPYMRPHEARRMLWMVALLGGLLAMFFGADWLSDTGRTRRSEDAEARARQQAWVRELEQRWDEIRRAHGLPAPDTATAQTASPTAGPIPLDTGLLAWVEDNTEERERAPLSHLLRYVLSRSQQQLEAEANPALRIPRTGPEGVGVDRKHVENLTRFVKAHRGQVMRVIGEVLDSYPRVLEDPRYPVPVIEETVLLDDQKQVWIVIAAEKKHDFQPHAGSVRGDRVLAVGPLFKVLRVETEDKDPTRRFKHYPVLVVRSLEPAGPAPEPWRPTWWQVLATIAAMIVAGIVIGRVSYRPVPHTAAGARRRARLDVEAMRRLDRKQRPAQQDAAGGAPAGSESNPDAPSATAPPAEEAGPPAQPDTRPAASATEPPPHTDAAPATPAPASTPEPTPSGPDAGQPPADEAAGNETGEPGHAG